MAVVEVRQPEEVMLKLEKFKKNDIPTFLSWLENTDSRFLYLFAGPRYNFPLDKKQLLQTIDSDEYLMLKVIDLKTLKTIGHCQFMRINKQKSEASIGRILISQEYRGKGYGTKMMEVIIKYAKDNLKISNLKLRVFNFNRSAIICYRNIGFIETSTDINIIPEFNETWKCTSMELTLK